jgi:hypothetical protein
MATRALATAFVNIVPGTKDMEKYLKGDLSKGVDVAGKNAGTQFGNGFSGAFKKIAGAAVLAIAAKQVADFVGSAVTSANKLFIEYEGVSSVFGKAAGSVQAFAKTAAKTAGISEAAALGAAKGFGGFATTAGLASEQAAKFSIDLTKAAGDMASFYGGGTEASLSAIKSALMGQYEPMLKYNQQLTEASVRQEAFALKLTDTTDKALTPQQKTLAVQSLLMKGLGVATGDFVTYADSFDNAQQTMTANFENMKASIGSSLLPVLGQLVAAINPLIEKAGPLLFDVFQKLIPLFEIVTDVIGKIMPALSPIIKAFGMFVDVIVKIIEIALPPFMAIINALLPALAPILNLFMALVQAILPPLARLIEKVLVPALMFVVDILVRYLIPYWTKLAELFGGALTVGVDLIIAGFQGLLKFLKPVWDFLKPMIEGLMSFAGIKPIKISASISSLAAGGPLSAGGGAAATSLAGIDYSKIGSAGVGATGTSTAKSAAATSKAISAAMKKFQKSTASAKKKYDTAVTKANADFASAQVKINKEYDSKVSDLTKNRDSDLAKATADHAANVLGIQKDFATKMADIVQQSKDRLRSAFESVTAVNVGETFANLTYKNVTSLVSNLKTRLADARNLVTQAASLASAGFSQTFIESVVSQGPNAGAAMAKSILAATPESQAELQALFADSEALANHGMDSLATAMYDKSGLATEALRTLYTQAQTDLTAALANEQSLYTAKQLEIQTAFNEGIAAAQVVRNDALAEAEATLTEALTAATKALNDSLDAIQKEFNDKLKEFKSQLKAHAKEITAIKDEIAAARAEAMKPIVITRIENVVVNTTTASSGSRVKLAAGGFVNGPTNALIGEAGPEVVMPLDRFEKVMGLSGSGASKTINYYAAPNQSLDAEQALFTAIRRAKVVAAW